jgi:DNA-binding response OmpR family regulator
MRLHPSAPNPMRPSRPEYLKPPRTLPSESLLSFILIVEDYAPIRRFMKAAVAPLAREVIATGSARKAVAIAKARSPDRILVDLRLPDMHGTALIARLRHLEVRSPIIVVTGYPDDLPDEISALGVLAVFHKPVTVRQLQNAVRAVPMSESPSLAAPPMNAAERWVTVVEAGLDSKTDPRTRTDLARCGHVSLGVFKDVCYQLDISARQTCRLVRVLRAIRIARERSSRLEDSLDVGDHRTLGPLLDAAGLTGGAEPPSIAAFLERQRFIPGTSKAIQLLKQRLARRR